MLCYRRKAAQKSKSYRAVRALYRCFFDERTPEGKGRQLLREWLTPDQRKSFDAEGYVDVIGAYSGKRYRIYYGVVSNIRELNDRGEPCAGLCLIPEQMLPPGDMMLAQKLALETDEQGALSIANYFPSSLQPPQLDWRGREHR
jgi:hypothetical protein